MAFSLRFALLLAALLGGGLVAQEARVRSAPTVRMPRGVDSNSPAFWRDGRLFWYGSHGRPWLNEAGDQFGPWETREVDLQTTNPWPKWMESVWPEENRVLWGWYHCEPSGLVEGSTLTAPKIGAVMSLDGGLTLRDLGFVLESGDPLNPGAQNGYFAGGHGDFTVLLNEERTYFYFFFDNYGGPAATQGVCLARMAYEDRFDPQGKVWKYCDGQWLEAGRGGRVTPVFPVRRPWEMKDPDAWWGPAVHWNTHLKCYVMLLNHASGEPGWSQTGIYVSFCSDLSRPETWTAPRQIVDKSQFSGWYFFYPQVMGLEADGTDRRAGQTARLYINGVSRWEIDFIAPPAPPTAVQLSVSPPSLTAVKGEPVTLSVAATGTAPLQYLWLRNGVAIPNATAATYELAAAGAEDWGNYSVVVTNAQGSAVSNGLTLTVADPLPPPGTYLSNLSVRSHLTSDRAVFTVGFVVQSAATKRLLVRGIGPTLASVGLAGGVADPRLEVFDAASLPIGGNDNWMPELAGRFAAMGAFALPAGSADAALLVDLPSRSGTAQVRATTEGLALIEIYDPTASVASKLVNLSALAQAGAGERALIAGFNIGGFGRKRLLIRAVGPGLAAFGVDGFLADPILEVYGTEGARITENDDWDAGLLPEFSAVGAPLLEPGSRDAALITTLTAGSVATVVVRSANGATGMALLEIYEAP